MPVSLDSVRHSNGNPFQDPQKDDMTQVTIDQAMQIAVQHHQAGRLQQAKLLYQQILAGQPEHISAMHNLGLIAHQTGRNDIAIDLIRQSIALQPNDADAHLNLGNVLAATGHLDEAITAYKQAIVLRPGHSQASYNLGNALRASGQRHEAIAAYRQAIASRPGYPEAYNNLGNALTDMGQLDDAIAAYRQGIALRPDDAQAHNNLGIALTDKRKHDQAIAACRKAIALNARSPKIHNNFGNALKNKGLLDEAVAAYRRAIALDSNEADAHNNLGSALKDAGQLDASIAAYRQAIAVQADHRQAHSNLIYALHFHAPYAASAIAEEHRLWNYRHAEPLQQMIRPLRNDPDPQRRLRVGYISPDFREHPVGGFLLPLLEQHDHSNFEVVCYADVRVPDRLTERFRGVADQWRSIVGMSDEPVAQLIRDDEIDILVDLTMHMANNRLLVFARKPAPVQVTWLAYPGTTGLEAMDYRLTDRYLDPLPVSTGPGETSAEVFYCEQSVRLPDCWFCYRPQDQTPDANELPALTSSHITFGCLNNFCKVTRETLKCWCGLLREVPGSRLLLHALEGSHRQGVKDLLADEGVNPGRLDFIGHLPVLEYLRLYHQIDICLDPFPYSGGTTSCDSLWMGVPVVSLSGRTAVGRLTSTILHNIGLPELVADSQEQYFRIAKELSADLSRLSQLRSTLRERMRTSPLMDEPRFARNIESAYRDMWRRWCQSRGR
jgi:protein O-GlcNAc transferase